MRTINVAQERVRGRLRTMGRKHVRALRGASPGRLAELLDSSPDAVRAAMRGDVRNRGAVRVLKVAPPEVLRRFYGRKAEIVRAQRRAFLNPIIWARAEAGGRPRLRDPGRKLAEPLDTGAEARRARSRRRPGGGW